MQYFNFFFFCQTDLEEKLNFLDAEVDKEIVKFNSSNNLDDNDVERHSVLSLASDLAIYIDRVINIPLQL